MLVLLLHYIVLVLDISDYLLLLVQLHPGIRSPQLLLLEPPFDRPSLSILVPFDFLDQRFKDGICLRAYLDMTDLNLVLFEEILQNILSTFRVMKCPVSFE